MSDPAGSIVNGSCIIEELERGRLTDEYWDYSLQGVEKQTHTSTAFLILIFLSSVPLNMYVFGRILWKRLQSEPTYMLLLNLCVSDLVMCSAILFNIITGLSGHYSFGSTDYIRCHVCKIAVVFIVANLVTAFNVALLSIDRCVYFVRPLRYPIHVTPRRTGVAIAGIWILGVLIPISALAGYGDVGFSFGCGFIFVNHRHIQRSYALLALNIIAFSVVAVVIAVTNILVLRIVYKQTKSVRVGVAMGTEMQVLGNRTEQTESAEQQKERDAQKRESKKQFKMWKVFGSIVFVNFITLMPTLGLVSALEFTTDIPTAYFHVVLLCIALRVTLQPLIEAFLTPQLRISVWNACKTGWTRMRERCCGCCSDVTILND